MAVLNQTNYEFGWFSHIFKTGVGIISATEIKGTGNKSETREFIKV